MPCLDNIIIQAMELRLCHMFAHFSGGNQSGPVIAMANPASYFVFLVKPSVIKDQN